MKSYIETMFAFEGLILRPDRASRVQQEEQTPKRKPKYVKKHLWLMVANRKSYPQYLGNTL